MYGTNRPCQLLGSRFLSYTLNAKKGAPSRSSLVVAAERVAMDLKEDEGCCLGDKSLPTPPPPLNPTGQTGSRDLGLCLVRRSVSSLSVGKANVSSQRAEKEKSREAGCTS